MNTRDRIIVAADQLFYSSSIRDTSMDKVAECAGVTKKTLYYHFRSKDDLVAASLEARLYPTIERYQSWAGDTGTVSERIERMFCKLAEYAQATSWKGCGFIRASVELADTPGHPALDVARQHKAAFEQWLEDDLRDGGYAEARSLARMIMILLDGAITRILLQRDDSYALEAGRAASVLLKK